MRMEVNVKNPSELTASERAAWREFQDADPVLSSPYFSLGFVDAVGAVRPDTRVLTMRRAGAVKAFLPLHAGVLRHARPLGGPLGDHHGLICEPGAEIDLSALLKAGGIGVFDFSGALASQRAFHPHITMRDGSWVADLSAGYQAFVEERARAEPKAFRNIRARRRKIEEAEGGFTFRIRDERPHVLEAAMAWKSDQYRRTGHFDVFSVSWTRRLMQALTEPGEGNCAGLVSSLEIGGKLAAVHLGMRSRSVLHYWFPVYDPQFSKFGPGLALLMEICSELSRDGVSEVHLGPGEYDFKAQLGAWQMPLCAGFAGSGPAALVRRAAQRIEAGAEALPFGPVSRLPGKAFRRIDRMAGFHAA